MQAACRINSIKKRCHTAFYLPQYPFQQSSSSNQRVAPAADVSASTLDKRRDRQTHRHQTDALHYGCGGHNNFSLTGLHFCHQATPGWAPKTKLNWIIHQPTNRVRVLDGTVFTTGKVKFLGDTSLVR